MIDEEISTEQLNTWIYIFGIIQEARDCGIELDNESQSTPKGIALFDQLVASGFIPDRITMLAFLIGLFDGNDEKVFNFIAFEKQFKDKLKEDNQDD